MSCCFGLDPHEDCRDTPCQSCTGWDDKKDMGGGEVSESLVERLRCNYNGLDFSGEMLVTLPTPIMLEAAQRIEELICQKNGFQLTLQEIASDCETITSGDIGMARLAGYAKDALKGVSWIGEDV